MCKSEQRKYVEKHTILLIQATRIFSLPCVTSGSKFLQNGYDYKKVLKYKNTIKESFKISPHQTSTDDSHDDCNQDDLRISSGDRDD